jgi:hypothetical protein
MSSARFAVTNSYNMKKRIKQTPERPEVQGRTTNGCLHFALWLTAHLKPAAARPFQAGTECAERHEPPDWSSPAASPYVVTPGPETTPLAGRRRQVEIHERDVIAIGVSAGGIGAVFELPSGRTALTTLRCQLPLRELLHQGDSPAVMT